MSYLWEVYKFLLCKWGAMLQISPATAGPAVCRFISRGAAEGSSQGREPLECARKRSASRGAATPWGLGRCRRSAAKEPFFDRVLGLTPQAIQFRRFAASFSTKSIDRLPSGREIMISD